jgi:GntR family transcriptional regulator, sialic acid-inducible nan operon repressor
MATVAIRRRKLYEDVADHLDKLIQAGAYARLTCCRQSAIS